MTKIVIIADDMTGALDSGVKLAAQGISSAAIIDRGFDIASLDATALIINTESRHVSAEEAYKRVFDAAKKAYLSGADIIYKKLDSTLRGNIGAELQAASDACEKRHIVLAPALPQSRYN